MNDVMLPKPVETQKTEENLATDLQIKTLPRINADWRGSGKECQI